jgi:RNA polymerase sigma factor (sigma-70 family)
MGQPDLTGDDALLAASARGDGVAFASFYRRHLALVLAFLMVRVRSPELAADLAAETFAGALLSCGRYEPGEQPAVAWLLGISRNKLRESARRHRIEDRARIRLGMPVLALSDDDLDRVEELAGIGRRALELLERLPAAQREAVQARVLEEREYKQLADELGCSEQVIRQRVSRGLRQLKTTMEREQ